MFQDQKTVPNADRRGAMEPATLHGQFFFVTVSQKPKDKQKEKTKDKQKDKNKRQTKRTKQKTYNLTEKGQKYWINACMVSRVFVSMEIQKAGQSHQAQSKLLSKLREAIV